MPRWKRMTATLGEGCYGIRWARLGTDIAYDFDFYGDFA